MQTTYEEAGGISDGSVEVRAQLHAGTAASRYHKISFIDALYPHSVAMIPISSKGSFKFYG